MARNPFVGSIDLKECLAYLAASIKIIKALYVLPDSESYSNFRPFHLTLILHLAYLQNKGGLLCNSCAVRALSQKM